MIDDPTDGLPFSHVYLRSERPLQDSERARIRLAGYAELNVPIAPPGFDHRDLMRLDQFLKVRHGIVLPSGYGGPLLGKFFRIGELPRVLDAITGVAVWLRMADRTKAEKWLAFVKQVFEEEHLGYRLDSRGGVRRRVDEQYERNRASTVVLLDQSRYGAVRDEFENSDKFLTEGKTKEAVVALYVAVEILSKLMTSRGISQLGSKEVNAYIRPIVENTYASDEVARTSANRLLTGLCDWINSAQGYRHGQHTEEPAPPPMDLRSH